MGNHHILRILLGLVHDGGLVDAAAKGAAHPGMTPLMFAAAGGHAKAVDALLEAHASLELVDANGWTALHHAAFNGRSDMCDKLAKLLGAEAVKSGMGSPLSLAASQRHLPACVALMRNGAAEDGVGRPADREWLAGAIAAQAEAAAAPAKGAPSTAGALAAAGDEYSDVEDVPNDDEESGDEEVRNGLGAGHEAVARARGAGARARAAACSMCVDACWV